MEQKRGPAGELGFFSGLFLERSRHSALPLRQSGALYHYPSDMSPPLGSMEILSDVAEVVVPRQRSRKFGYCQTARMPPAKYMAISQ